MNLRPPTEYLSKAQQVAQDLLARIDDSNVQPGQSFGTEAELLRQFNVSRPTLREGIRILESLGVLDRRPGPGGGLVIRRPSLDMLAHTLSVFLRFNDVPFVTMLQAREVIEPALAAEAATEGTDDHFREMAESIERMKGQGEDQEAFIAENRTFHSIVARASGNKVLEIFWGTISLLAHGEHHGMKYTFANRQHVIAAHQQILKACLKRDARAAARAMSEHVGELELLVKDHYKHLLKRPMHVHDHRRGA
ncbi:MAG: FCD domain-containing protein [Betaproteobacteria bacterium]